MSQLNFVSELLKRCHILHITVMLNLLIIQWMQSYAQALIDLALPLYVKYGIALEAHLQNSIVSVE
jgi:hypothetical protein